MTQHDAGFTDNADLYLESVHRELLEPDATRICGITLADTNVYVCLSCGEYLQGRGKSTPAYAHALGLDHHLFLRTDDSVVYVLPEGRVCPSKLLEDVKQAFNPMLAHEAVLTLDEAALKPCIDLSKKQYYKGFVGINRLGENGALNTLLLALAHTRPIRDKLLLLPLEPEKYMQQSILLQELSLLFRKLWRGALLRKHVSAAQVASAMSKASNGVFSTSKILEPGLVLAFFLDFLHRQLGGSRAKPIVVTRGKRVTSGKRKETAISLHLEGVLQVETQNVRAVMDTQDTRLRFLPDTDIQAIQTSFKILTLTLPPIPVFAGTGRAGAQTGQVVVELQSLLSRYDGNAVEEGGEQRKRYTLLSLPKSILILSVQRTVASDFQAQRNKAIVRFPLTLDLAPLLSGAVERTVALFDLFCVIARETETGEWFSYIKQRQAKGSRWFKCAGLACSEVPASELAVGEATIFFWERRSS